MPHMWAGRFVMLGVGSFLAGFYFMGRDLAPYLAARRNGVIPRRGHKAILVRRDEEPDRFARLLANRTKGVMLGLGLTVGGAAALVLGVLVLFNR